MREVLPLQSSLEYLATTIGYDKKVLSSLLVSVHEDNAACLKLATLPPGQFTPRTKFYAVKVHWFWSKLNKQRSRLIPNYSERIFLRRVYLRMFLKRYDFSYAVGEDDEEF